MWVQASGDDRGIGAMPLRARISGSLWINGLLIGLCSAAIIVLLSIALLIRSTLSRLGEVASGGADYMWLYVVKAAMPVVGFYIALGAAVGLAAVWITRRSTKLASVAATATIWGILAIAAIPVSPGSVAKIPVFRDLPFAVVFSVVLCGTLALAVVARVQWWRLLSVAVVAIAPLLLPPLPVQVRPIPEAAKGSVLLLGIDDIDREDFQHFATELYSLDGISRSGFRLLAEAVSPMPVTRFAWRSIIAGTPPMSLVGLDSLSPSGWRHYYEEAPFLITRVARELGYKSTYLSDDATTNNFLPGEAFDVVREDAIGWQIEAHYRLRLAFPLYAGYIGRHIGMGIPGTPGSDRSLRVYGAIGKLLGEASGPQFIAAHVVSLHGPLKPTISEMGGVLAFLRLSPRDLETLGIADEQARYRFPSNRLPQRQIYTRRRLQALRDAETFLAKLDRAGYRRSSLTIVFSDHGELFLDGAGRNTVGVHGTVLEPRSAHVAALALLPSSGREEPLVTIRGTFPLMDIARLAREFMELSAGGHAGSGLLDSVSRGTPLPRRMILSRSVGRPEFPGDLYEGRRTFRWADLRGQVHLLPDGRISLSSSGLHAMLVTEDIGYTDGQTLVACSPMADGTYVLERYNSITRTLLARFYTMIENGPQPEEPCTRWLAAVMGRPASDLSAVIASERAHAGDSP